MIGRWKKPKPDHVYSYVGEHEYSAGGEGDTAEETRQRIASADEISAWVGKHGEEAEFDRSVPACYIVDTDYEFWIASRFSEHVTLAKARPVLAAGEVFFGEDGGVATVERITNQSTGYCPEPSSFKIAEFVLAKLKIPHPEEFDPAFQFRWCKPCGNIEIVKDGDFTCLMCGEELPEEWNLDQWRQPVADEEQENSEEG
jgi:hypothetical protein